MFPSLGTATGLNLASLGKDIPDPWERGRQLLPGMAIAGVVVLGPLVPILIKVAVQFPFQDLLDTALLEFLQKTVGLVPRFELLQEIVVEQSYFLHYVQIFKIG